MKRIVILVLCVIAALPFAVTAAAAQGDITSEEAEMQTLGVNEKIYIYQHAEIHYYTAGDASNPPIIFLHPAFADHHIFVKQLAFFKDDYYIVMIDMIGHGESQQEKLVVNMADMPAVVNEICGGLDIQSGHLAGVSLGSLVAQAVADQYPALTKSVTVVGGYSIHKDNEAILKAQNKEIGGWLFKLIFNIEKLRDSVTEQSVYTEYGKKVFRDGTEKYNRKSFLAMNGMKGLFVDKAEPVAYPLLLIYGEYDLDLAKDAGKRLAVLEPNGGYIEIKEAGHCANIDNPEAFNSALKMFLDNMN